MFIMLIYTLQPLLFQHERSEKLSQHMVWSSDSSANTLMLFYEKSKKIKNPSSHLNFQNDSLLCEAFLLNKIFQCDQAATHAAPHG